MTKKLTWLLFMLLPLSIFSQTIIEDKIVVDLTADKNDSYRILKRDNSWQIGMKRWEEAPYFSEFYNFEIEQEVTFNNQKVLTPAKFDQYILELYDAERDKTSKFNIGRVYATNLTFPNLLIKINVDDQPKFFKAKFSMTFISY